MSVSVASSSRRCLERGEWREERGERREERGERIEEDRVNGRYVRPDFNKKVLGSAPRWNAKQNIPVPMGREWTVHSKHASSKHSQRVSNTALRRARRPRVLLGVYRPLRSVLYTPNSMRKRPNQAYNRMKCSIIKTLQNDPYWI